MEKLRRKSMDQGKKNGQQGSRNVAERGAVGDGSNDEVPGGGRESLRLPFASAAARVTSALDVLEYSMDCNLNCNLKFMVE